MKFKSDIEVQAGLRDGSNDIGTAGQLLSSTGTITNWIDQGDVVAAGATRVLIACKNTSGGTITKGTPVYQTGNVGATDVIEVAEADALISTGYLPAIGLLETDLINNAFGHVVITGELLNITTSPIDGVVPVTGDTIYLKSGGGLTLTKPTGEGNAIQNLGLVGKVSGGNAGSLTVSSIMRQNDVPNLPEGRIWIGDGNTLVSDTVYVDEPNNRVGIGTTSPSTDLEVSSTGVNGVDISQSASNASQSGRLFFTTNTASEGFALFNSNGTFQVNSGGIPNNTSGTNRISIVGSSGNVGIGTTTPSYKLDVSGDAYIDETLNIETTISGSLAFGYAGVGAGNLVVGGMNLASFTPGVITLINQDTTISAGQDLGVLQFGGKDDQTNGYANGQIICTTAVGAGSGNTGGGIFRFLLSGNTSGSSPSERMRITNTGSVGIGTTSPSAKLDVYGNLRLGTTGTFTIAQSPFSTTAFYVGAGNGSTITFGAPASNTQDVSVQGDLYSYQGSIGTKLSGSFNNKISYNGNNYLNSGNLGIGTASPGEKLEVNGSVKATASTDAYKGYIKQSITSIANEKQDNADYNLIPMGGTITTTPSDQYYNRMVAAYDGRIKKVYIRNTGGNTPTSDTVNFKKQVNNTTSSTVYSATVANAGSAGMSAVYNFADNDFTFSEGDTFGILYQTVNANGSARSMGGVAINIIIEYNIT